MNFCFEFLDIHMNEKKKKTCHYYYGFKWQNINIYQILIIFLWSPMFFLVCWIVTTRSWTIKSFICALISQHDVRLGYKPSFIFKN
jgi:hypothetical protein